MSSFADSVVVIYRYRPVDGTLYRYVVADVPLTSAIWTGGRPFWTFLQDKKSTYNPEMAKKVAMTISAKNWSRYIAICTIPLAKETNSCDFVMTGNPAGVGKPYDEAVFDMLARSKEDFFKEDSYLPAQPTDVVEEEVGSKWAPEPADYSAVRTPVKIPVPLQSFFTCRPKSYCWSCKDAGRISGCGKSQAICPHGLDNCPIEDAVFYDHDCTVEAILHMKEFVHSDDIHLTACTHDPYVCSMCEV
jgi:hypothetical protein